MVLESVEVERVDRHGLYRDYVDWPHHAKEALKIDVKCPESIEAHRIVIGGMGGSGIIGDILQDWLQFKIDIPIHVVKDYHLPRFVDRRSFVIVISCSGETEEALSILAEALKRGAAIATISSGGMLEEVSVRKGICHTKIKMLLTPRSSLPYMLYTSAKVLLKSGLIDGFDDELKGSISVLEDVGRSILPTIDLEQNISKQIADWLHLCLPVIYASSLHRSAAIRFKNSLNENAKVHALVEILPELCHNDLATWLRDGIEGWRPLFIRYPNEPIEVFERFNAVKEIIEDSNVDVMEVMSKGRSDLDYIISMIYILDFASIYSAILRGIDPTPIQNIDRLKATLGKRLKYVERFVKI
ncbi:MAG: bifunctional phosphoglucose/phosphomannose isomerase [Nitrososphaerota archaeon]|nr:bifunctional phosphoglucose/phosphomannose isomerase [Nitrososphaerales archaeon]MDW8045373.1 bifunctional phosphoglucose/phosphomannose isomerase [Nitrososphaerota archaeon]